MANLLSGRDPKQYLPPAGVYYDQHDLDWLFGYNHFEPGRCWTCFASYCPAARPQDCNAACGVCGYAGICPMLYCSYTWFAQHYVPHSQLDIKQFRPGQDQADALEYHGMIHHLVHFRDAILPKVESASVKQLYNCYGIGPVGRLQRRKPVIWAINVTDRGQCLSAIEAPHPTVTSDLTISYITGLLGPGDVAQLKQEVDIIRHLSLGGAAVALFHMGANLLMSIPAVNELVRTRDAERRQRLDVKEDPQPPEVSNARRESPLPQAQSPDAVEDSDISESSDMSENSEVSGDSDASEDSDASDNPEASENLGASHAEVTRYYQEELKLAERRRLKAVSELRRFQAQHSLIPKIPNQEPSHPDISFPSGLSQIDLLTLLEQYLLSSEERRIAAEQELVGLKLQYR